jgi:hypothetical protein
MILIVSSVLSEIGSCGPSLSLAVHRIVGVGTPVTRHLYTNWIDSSGGNICTVDSVRLNIGRTGSAVGRTVLSTAKVREVID